VIAAMWVLAIALAEHHDGPTDNLACRVFSLCGGPMTSLRHIAAEIALLKSEKGYGHQQDDRLLRVDEVLKRVGVSSRVTLWRWTQAGRFPKARQVGPNVVRWSEREVSEWMAERKAKGEA
jgi:prophage regulatory protein